MKRYILLLILLTSFISCKVKTTNQTVNKKRQGLWIENESIDSTYYQSVGRYKNDELVKKWRYYVNGKLNKKERYYKEYCKIKFFYENRKKQATGITQSEQTTDGMHWYYSGKWKYYDQKRNLKTVRFYKKGTLISEVNN